MVSNRWDPGIFRWFGIKNEVHGKVNCEGFNDEIEIRWKAIEEILDMVSSADHRNRICIDIRRRLNGIKGDCFLISFFSIMERGLLQLGLLDIKRIQGDTAMRSGKIRCDFQEIRDDSMESLNDSRSHYIRGFSLRYKVITFIAISSHKFAQQKVLRFLWFMMTHGQLVGTLGENRNVEGTRKRLKITVAHFDNTDDLIKSCSKILVGRCMNPPEQEMKALLSNLPKIWKLEDRVVGKDLGLGKFQFEFEHEEDMEGVLRLQPYHFDYWMVALGKWQPKKSLNYPSEIPFWVRILGVSKEYRTIPTFESIGDMIGRVIEVDLDLMRVLVVVDAFKELCFETSVDFKGGEFYDGEEVPILLRYEKLFGYCEHCGSLCHQNAECPLVKGFKNQSVRKVETREGDGRWQEGYKHDDRARSYKGALIHGNGNQQSRERETRDYYGKGKGKMGEETDSKWSRGADRGSRKSGGNKGAKRFEGEEWRPRNSRTEGAPPREQTGNKMEVTGHTGAQQNDLRSKEDAQEEGEISNVVNEIMIPPSKEFAEALANTQALGVEVVSEPIDAVKGLKQLQGLVEGQLRIDEDEGMEWDVVKETGGDQGLDLEAADDLPELTEEELAEINLDMEENAALVDKEELLGEGEEKEQQAGDDATKQVTKKRLFKATVSTAASTKMRSAKALASPRKRAPLKVGNRNGENRYQQESKIASNLLSAHQKP